MTIRRWRAAWTALVIGAAGCGGGTTPNGAVAPSITSTPPSSATVGVPFNYTVTVDGMTPISFAVVSGPEGFEIHRTSGVVTWVPMATGKVSIEVEATNLAGRDTQAFDVTVASRTGPVFTTEPPTEATVAATYAYDPRVVADGTVSWSAVVAPTGLTIDPESGAVRWTPTSDQAGDRTVTIRATEDGSGRATDQSFTVTVIDTGGPAVITSTPPDRVYAGEVWRYAATAAGAPTVQWSVVAPSNGTPAPGVVIVTDPPEGSDVLVEWDTGSVSPGEYSVALEVSNGLGDPSTQQTTVIVDPRPPVPAIDLVTTPPPGTVFVGSTYTYDVNLTPASESEGVVFSLIGPTIPDDLAITIDPDSGEVSFTASESNGEITYSYGVRAENVLGDGDQATIVVDAVHPPAVPVLTVMPAATFTLEVGESFPGASATATGNPAPTLTISGTLPDFLGFDPLTGLLSASASKPSPEEADIGLHSFDVVATNTEGTDSATIDITVIAAPPGVDSVTPAAGRRQSDVPIVVRGAGFVEAVSPVVRLELGATSETLPTTFIDENTLSAVVPTDGTRPSGVYDVVVDQGSTTTLSKRFTVTEGTGTTLTGTIASDRTLTALASPHVVTGDVFVESGATLTIEPGAVLMFAGNSELRIDVGVTSAGALVADGGVPGVGDQIVFTRLQDVGGPPASGHYRGLRFGANNVSATTKLRNVVLEFGGRRNTATEQGALEVLSGSAPRATDSIIRESLNYGLYGQSGAGSATVTWFDDNQLTHNARGPVSMGANDVSTLGRNLDVLGNGMDRIYVRGSTVNRADAAWTNYEVPYFLSAGLSVRGGATMSLEPGTQMRFAPNQRLVVARDGTGGETATLIASGTPEAPIRMVADSTAWGGVWLEDNTQAGTVLRNVQFEGFGGGADGGLRVDPILPIAIVESCVFRSDEPGSVGVYLALNARVSSFENNVVDVEELTINAAMPGFSDMLRASNVYEAPLRLRSSNATGVDMTWSRPAASDSSTQPIRPNGNLAVTNGSLTIAAGNRIEMPLGGQLITTNSRLVIDGTASEPVVFAPAAGADYWNRIRVRGPGAGGVSRMSHTVLHRAGSDPALDASTSRAALVVEASGGLPATPAVSNTVVSDSNGYGITFADATHCAGACNDNTIVGARFAAVYMSANFVGRFGTGNAMAGNNTSGTLGHEGVWVAGDVVDTAATWHANDVPYVVQGDIELRQAHPFDPVPVMTIEPGAELRFGSGRRLRVGDGNEGVLDARGTSSAPIVFTSIDETAPVFWRGIDFNQGSDGSILDHVVVSYGGQSDGTGNVNFRIGSVATVGVAKLSHSEEYGAVFYGGSAPMFTGPPTDRVYELNGQQSNPGPGDPAFDCVRDATLETCNPL